MVKTTNTMFVSLFKSDKRNVCSKLLTFYNLSPTLTRQENEGHFTIRLVKDERTKKTTLLCTRRVIKEGGAGV